MRVGIYFDLRNPPAWSVDWARLYGFTLEMCEEAERLGCPSIWLSEHHLFDDAYLPAPMPFAARMAGGVNGWVTEDPEADWPRVSKHVAAQLDSYRRHMVEGTDQPVPRPVDPEKLRSRQSRGGPLDAIMYGTPEEMADKIK